MTCYNTIHSKYNMSWNVDTKQEDAMKVVGLGDNVVDKYEHIRVMYPGGNAMNFAVFARQLGVQTGFSRAATAAAFCAQRA